MTVMKVYQVFEVIGIIAFATVKNFPNFNYVFKFLKVDRVMPIIRYGRKRVLSSFTIGNTC